MKNNIKSELTIPTEVMSSMSDEVTLQAFEGVIVLKNTKMTTLEVVKTIEALESLIEPLYTALLTHFPQDGGCDDCNFCKEFMEDAIDVPDWAKEAVGLATDTKLCMITEEDSGRIILEPLGSENDLSDVSEEMQRQLESVGICLGELNESILSGEVIYAQ